MDNEFLQKFNRLVFITKFNDNNIEQGIQAYNEYVQSITDDLELATAKKIYTEFLEKVVTNSSNLTDKVLCYKELLTLHPSEETYLYQTAKLLGKLKQFDMQADILKTLEQSPNAEKYSKIFTECYINLEQYEKAMQWHELYCRNESLSQQDRLISAQLNLKLYHNTHRPNYVPTARKLLIKTYLANKKCVDALKGLIEIAHITDKPQKAAPFWKKIIKLAPTSQNHYEYAKFCLENGDYEEGFKNIYLREKPHYPALENKPEWDGAKTNKRVLIIAESNLGDTIAFAKYISKMVVNVRNRVLYVNEEEYPIFKNSFAGVKVFSKNVDIEDIDFDEYVFIADIPYKLGIKKVLPTSKYLSVDIKALNAFKAANDIQSIQNLGLLDYNDIEPYEKIEIGHFLIFEELPLQICSLQPNVSDEYISEATSKIIDEIAFTSREKRKILLQENYHINNIGKNISTLYELALAASSMDVVITRNPILQCLAPALGIPTIGICRDKKEHWSFNSNFFSSVHKLDFKPLMNWTRLEEKIFNTLVRYIKQEKVTSFHKYKIDRLKNLLEIDSENPFVLHDIAQRYMSSPIKDFENGLNYASMAADILPAEVFFSTVVAALKEKHNSQDTEEYRAERDTILAKYDNRACYAAQGFQSLGDRNYVDGLKYYRYRESGTFPTTLPRWDGTQDLSNATICVVWEQGLGDNIMASRYLLGLQKIAKKVIYLCRRELYSFFKVNFEGIEIINSDVLLGKNNRDIVEYMDSLNADYYVAIMDLMYCFGFDGTDYPYSEGYLKVDDSIVQKFKEKHVQKDTFNIGIVNRGIVGHMKDRNISLHDYAALSHIEGVQLYSLVYHDALYKYKDIPVINLGKEFNDFIDTAAAIQSMDLVVSTDSGVLHLAGALGKKAFAILKSDPEWRWKKEESDSSGWYDSVSTYLNKDPRDYDWQDTIARIAKDVEKLVKQKK